MRFWFGREAGQPRWAGTGPAPGRAAELQGSVSSEPYVPRSQVAINHRPGSPPSRGRDPAPLGAGFAFGSSAPPLLGT
ncbi:hypothetical protein AV530_001863 [Patagioenas fasciata monilis]|uniref:Uncharacterized protein n=1 Tax=Patagioenas fasciata monilis TaxID=372326 RepID=A0A1V4J705_PATFA|nr:hypothetical protein AV530_001863 [Patagioenas fasciata monilis]